MQLGLEIQKKKKMKSSHPCKDSEGKRWQVFYCKHATALITLQILMMVGRGGRVNVRQSYHGMLIFWVATCVRLLITISFPVHKHVGYWTYALYMHAHLNSTNCTKQNIAE